MSALGVTSENRLVELRQVSPARGKNPRDDLLGVQQDLGGRLLRAEVKELDPQLVLVLSGRGFAEPFMAGARFHPDWRRDGALQFDGDIEGRRWLIVSHPGQFDYRYRATAKAISAALDGTATAG